MVSRLTGLVGSTGSRSYKLAARLGALLALGVSSMAFASDADLILPDFKSKMFFGMTGQNLLLTGFGVCVLGLVFGFIQYTQLRRLPVHKSMLEVSELIYETCKTYLYTQFKFLIWLEVLTGIVMFGYFFFLRHMPILNVLIVLAFSVLGIIGSSAVAFYGIRVNTFANSRTAFASLRGKPFPTMAIPLQAGMSIGMVLISLELAFMLFILLLVPAEYAGSCFIGFAIGESLGASALRIAGGIFTKIADIGSDLMKIVFKIKEDDARNPGVIADCVGDNAGDSVGPSADGFETYGVTGVALITFILIAVAPAFRVELLVWIFTMRIVMVVASLLSYLGNNVVSKARWEKADKMNFETPLTVLVWVTSIVSVIFTYAISYALIGNLNGDPQLWWKLATIITCGTLAGAIIPEVTKAFTSTESGHVREVVTSSREGGASLNVISGLVAGNFSAYWMGVVVVALMGVALHFADASVGALMVAPGVFAFGLVAFGFLGMGPVTIAVDSYGPVTDNAQSVYELSLIENVPDIKNEVQKQFGFVPDFEKGKMFLEENDGAGNTFKATAKPVLIGTAVVGSTTMIFSIIVLLVGRTDLNTGLVTLQPDLIQNLSLLHAPFLLGLILGGAMIYWFSGASMQAVSTGAYRAVEFIKRNIKLEGAEKANVEDSKKVVAICTQYAQKGMINIFLAVFFATLSFAMVDPYFFVGYLISIAIFGLYQAVFMANAGGAWDNAKKLVETELHAKGTDLHAACVVGDTVGDPFKDTSSVALNPVIKFSTLFGLLTVELAVELVKGGNQTLTLALAAVFFVVSAVFVWRSFYGMRIVAEDESQKSPSASVGTQTAKA